MQPSGDISVGFWNSVRIVIPSTLLSIFLGAINGYALSFWRVRWAGALLGELMLGAFVPYQVVIYPLVKALAAMQLFGRPGPGVWSECRSVDTGALVNVAPGRRCPGAAAVDDALHPPPEAIDAA